MAEAASVVADASSAAALLRYRPGAPLRSKTRAISATSALGSARRPRDAAEGNMNGIGGVLPEHGERVLTRRYCPLSDAIQLINQVGGAVV